MAGVAPPDPRHCPERTRALALIAPTGGRRFWECVTKSPEWHDGAPHPIDRWSRRVLSALAADFGGQALFPFDGPPFLPFHAWALATGRIWESPVRWLIGAEHGLWISFRGALALPFVLSMPTAERPCERCTEKPCLVACPVGALGPQGYQAQACHAFLDKEAGRACLEAGCRVRAACPISLAHGRVPEQSAYHMRQFHP